MRQILSRLGSAAGIALAFGLGSNAVAQTKTITIGKLDWASAIVEANILKIVLEREVGAKVQLQPATYVVQYEAMNRGKGDIDVDPETWYPNHANLMKRYVEEAGTVELNKKPYDTFQGICVTKMTADKYGIRSIEQLASAETAKLFGGKLWIGPQGWGSTNVERAKAHSYGYDNFFELTTGDETFNVAALDSAVRQNKPYVFYCAGPTYVFLQWQLIMLKEPPYDPAKWKYVPPDADPDWINKSTVGMAWPPGKAYIAFSKSLRMRAPAAADILSNAFFSRDDAQQWDYEVVVNKRDMEDVAKDWVAKNEDKIKQWLNPAN
jgi:glycine betaine/proline transport system substrate-binding protein